MSLKTQENTKKIYLIRHCKAEGQPPEAKLTEVGVDQALELKEFLKSYGIKCIVSSPYVRAVHTITPLSEEINIPVNIDERFKEKVLTSKDVEDFTPLLKAAFVDMDLKYEGGESSREAMARAIEALSDLLNREENNIAVVTHGELFSLTIKYFEPSFGYEGWKSLSNPDVYVLTIEGKNIKDVDIKRIWK
ncbi:histidine phosphatase family protein [Clostridium sp.]|uniref:histidine phosphatase family protein n=1 Tax=Clostridium sp. TaxID=1506 RepID=UPI002FC7C8B0